MNLGMNVPYKYTYYPNCNIMCNKYKMYTVIKHCEIDNKKGIHVLIDCLSYKS